MAISREKIKALREARAWSQAHLAEAAGLSLHTVQRVEAEGTASAETRLALAAALGVPVESLDEPVPPPAVAPEIDPDAGPGGRLLVPLTAGVGVIFALWLGPSLPARVASHFGVGGDANGWMSRDAFVVCMALILGTLPSALSWALSHALRDPQRVRIPHAAYWFEPPRRAATRDWLRRHVARLCAGLSVFLAWNFWLVACANRGAPAHPALDRHLMLAGLAILVLAQGVWIAALLRRFRR